MSTLDPRELLACADRAARAGGEVVRRYFGRLEAVREKSPGDWVSEADLTSEQVIRDLLVRETDLPVFGEEAGGEEFDTGWLVDPLDGTANFLHGYPWWSISIAAAIDGELVAGTVWHVPARRRYTAWQGGGAWCGPERLRVSNIDDPAASLLGTGFPFKAPLLLPPYLKGFERVTPLTSGVRRAGSAALDLADVAQGRFEAFWELVLAPWDIAAGIVLVREAGGIVTDLGGAPAGPRHGGIVAGNPRMHEWLLGQIQDARWAMGDGSVQ
jgi:myo-inositol-1(or 4)-monophosphatase